MSSSSAPRFEFGEQETRIQALERRIAEQEEARAATARRLAALGEQRDALLAERAGLERRLAERERYLALLESSLSVRLVSRFWRLLRQALPPGSRRHRAYQAIRRLLGRPTAAAPAAPGSEGTAPPAPDVRAELMAFEDRARAAGAGRVVAVLSPTQLLEDEGQRPTQLALELARREVPVVFCYWRWWDTEWRPQDRLGQGIYQVPVDVVAARPELLAAAFEGLERIALFEFPHPSFFELLAAANGSGWLTLYDVLDDWEEFHRVGQAVWYDRPFECHLIAACDAVFAINEVLAERIRGLGGGRVAVVGNGVKPGIVEVREPRPLPRGEVTVGYFGYLAGAWFDWELIAEAARRRPAWRFYLIGYGGSPEGVALPDNVALLGKQPQRDLAAYAVNWDVAVIPFKPDRLAAGADPIKTYEYLAMGLPVVSTGVYPPPGGERFVARAEGVAGFLAALAAAAALPPEEAAARRAFAAGATWGARLDAMLAALAPTAVGGQRVAEKRALFGVAP